MQSALIYKFRSFKQKKFKSISLFVKELLELKESLRNQVARFVGFFTIYVCAYYFITNKDIELIFFLMKELEERKNLDQILSLSLYYSWRYRGGDLWRLRGVL